MYWITPLFNGVALVLAVALASRQDAADKRRRSLEATPAAGEPDASAPGACAPGSSAASHDGAVSPPATPIATHPFHHQTNPRRSHQMTSSTRRTVRRLGVVAGAGVSPSPSPARRSATTRPARLGRTGPRGPGGRGGGERVAPYLEPATSIGIDAPVEGDIPTDVSVYWLEGNIQSILPITTGFEAATDALGWDLTTLSYDPTDPQGAGRGDAAGGRRRRRLHRHVGPDHRHPGHGARGRQVRPGSP